MDYPCSKTHNTIWNIISHYDILAITIQSSYAVLWDLLSVDMTIAILLSTCLIRKRIINVTYFCPHFVTRNIERLAIVRCKRDIFLHTERKVGLTSTSVDILSRTASLHWRCTSYQRRRGPHALRRSPKQSPLYNHPRRSEEEVSIFRE